MKVLFSHLLGTTFQNMYSGSPHGVRPFDENSANVADYLHDSLFHGLRSILGEDVVDHIEMWHMYDSADEEVVKNFHGKGFTIWRLLKELNIDREDIESKIRNHYYDYIILPIHWTISFVGWEGFDFVGLYEILNNLRQYYKKEEIILIEGWDRPKINTDFFEYGLYFKRELNETHSDTAFPISFSIPKEKMLGPEEKEKDFARLVPWWNHDTYVYDHEDPYYRDYRISRFAYTCKKGQWNHMDEGWDCMRHYEILACGCVPFFTNIEICPKDTMVRFPKDLMIEAKKIKGIVPHTSRDWNPEVDTYLGSCRPEANDLQKSVPAGHIDHDIFDEDEYSRVSYELFEYTKKNLSTESEAKHLLDRVIKCNS